MADGIRKEVREQVKATLKEKGFWGKIWYILSYYTVHILIVGILIAVAITTIVTIITKKEQVLSVAIVNGPYGTDYEQYEIDYCEAVGIDTETSEILIDSGYSIGFGENANVMGEYAAQKLVASASMGTLDIIVADKETFDYMAMNGYMLSLDELLTAEQLEKWSDNLVLAEVESQETEGEFIEEKAGLDATKATKVVDGGWFSKDGCYVGVCYYSPNRDRAVEFLEYIMSE